MKQPLVSIIVPIYKVEPYLRRCLDSIVKQTYTNLEIILVDDGSPDGCPQICDEYAAKDKRIVVIHKENGGLSDARNAGLDICKGEYISFVDSDDWVSENYIEVMLNIAIKENADISICNHNFVHNDGSKKNIIFEERTYTKKEALKKIILQQTLPWGASWGKIYKRKIFNKYKFPVGIIHEDDYTSYKFIYEADKIVCIDKTLYNYFQRSDSISKLDTTYDFTEVRKNQLTFLLENKEYELAELTAINLCWHYLNSYCAKKEDGKKNFLHFFSQLKKIPSYHTTKRLCLYPLGAFPSIYPIYKKTFFKIKQFFLSSR
ncbi:glycosyltransferase involved in cell wall biosynthesis [Hallerella porci]|uniref:Glycosyltransferase involved in cell wall biosynthesis n=1 Tax=Hallerella porci TaxID=1945871 RepID=A0ABX5LIQ1_9BACT|nr:glycosyltransferase [Hallerella porci]PWK93828.1 glycosyltransferase involved in cell wall biosynthesis [Hallerella porci]